MKIATVCLTLLAACAGQTAPPEQGGNASPVVSRPPPTFAPPMPSASAPVAPAPAPTTSADAPPAVGTAPASAREDVAKPPEVRPQPGRRNCGDLVGSSFEHWRGAIEGYVSVVRPGNQRALNAAALPFAKYISGMHRRIHPLFTDCFLESLDARPQTDPMNDRHLVTRLEIVLSSDGRLKRMGVVRTSGITAFDIAALDAVERAQPFGPAPGEILSADGNVYLQWELQRDEVFACSTMNARPVLLVDAP